MSWFPKQKVVVPTDFSQESFAALDTAVELVDDPAHIHVVHVLQSLSAVEPGVVWDELTDEKRCEQTTNALKDRLSDEKYRGAHVEVFVGDPGSKIAEYAEQEKAELIVLPSHGRRGLTRLLLGSVAERVIRLAHCPVLVMRK